MNVSRSEPDRHRVLLIGPGVVGTAVASILARSGHNVVGVGPPERGSASWSAEILGAPTVAYDSLPPADVVLIGAPKSAIESIAREIGRALEPGAIVCHFAGSVGTEPLSMLPARVGRAALHPVQTCPDVDTAVARLPGSAWGVTCAPELRAWAFSLIEDSLHGRAVEVPEETRAAWHAAAVMTANGVSALLAIGEEILEAIGVPEPHSVLTPLAAGAVANARDAGGGAALTGPVVRGEIDVIRSHMGGLPDELRASYRLVAQTIISAARRADRIDDTIAKSMTEVLDRQ